MLAGGTAHSGEDAHVGAAAAQIGLMCLRISFSEGGGIAPQQRLRPHDHAGDAEAALRRLLGDEGPLQRTGIVNCAKTLRAS